MTSFFVENDIWIVKAFMTKKAVETTIFKHHRTMIESGDVEDDFFLPAITDRSEEIWITFQFLPLTSLSRN